MADYSKQLFEMFAAPGEDIQGNRDRAENARRYNESAARQMFNDEQAQKNTDRVFDRGVVTSDRDYGRGVFESDRGYGLQERNFNRGAYESDRNYDLAKEQAARKDVPRLDTFFDDQGREVKGILNPSAPGGYIPVGGAKAPPVQRQQMLMAGDRKAVLEADEGVQAGQNVIGALDRAIQLSPKAYTGPTAGARGYLTSVFGSDAGQATEELKNTVTAQALDQLKATFGGMPTEGERKILLDIQGSVNQAPAVRETIFKRAKAAAERRIDFNRKQATALRSGHYYSPDYQGPAIDAAPPQGGGQQGSLDTGSAIDLARQAIQAGADPQAVLERLRQAGIDPGDL